MNLVQAHTAMISITSPLVHASSTVMTPSFPTFSVADGWRLRRSQVVVQFPAISFVFDATSYRE